MKKILIAFDGEHFSEGAFEFAHEMNELSPILLTGVFMPLIDYSALWSYSATAGGVGMLIPMLEDENAAMITKNINRFNEMCQSGQIEHRVHRDFSEFALPSLRKETRFADLMLLGSESFYENIGISDPNIFLKEAIHNSECPVLVVPEQYEFPQKNILAYDGSASSVYAIKQFAYLFPELADNKTVLLYAKDEDEPSFPDEHNIEELCSRHFSDLTLFKLGIDPHKYFGLWAGEKQRSIIVSGAYGRSSFSMMFRKSFVSDVIRDHKLPVFIANK
jgi:nucleotide-binding universal stress UspA family protein